MSGWGRFQAERKGKNHAIKTCTEIKKKRKRKFKQKCGPSVCRLKEGGSAKDAWKGGGPGVSGESNLKKKKGTCQATAKSLKCVNSLGETEEGGVL